MNTQRHRPRRSAGFTLAEVLIVLGVALALLALVGPAMAGFLARLRVEGIGNELSGDVQLARSEAIQRNLPIALSFARDGTHSCYTLHTVVTGGSCNCLNSVGGSPVCIGGATALKTVMITSASTVTVAASSSTLTQVQFDPVRGAASLPDLMIEVSSSLGGQVRAHVNSIGRVQLCSPDGSIRGVATPCP